MEQGGSGTSATGTGADIDTHIAGNVGQCRGQGDAFGKQADWFAWLSDAVRTAQGDIEFAWQGQSADRAHDYLGNLYSNLSQSIQSGEKARDAMHTFATDLDTSQRTMQQVMQVAHEGELDIAGTVVKWPNDPMPSDPQSTAPETVRSCPVPTATPQQVDAYNQAVARYNKRQQAYQECFQTATTARGQEQTAHENLVKNLQGASDGFQSLRTYGGKAMSTALAFAGSIDENTQKLVLRAATQRGVSDTLLAAIKNDPAKADLLGVQTQEWVKAYKLEKSAGKWTQVASTIPQWARNMTGRGADTLPLIKNIPALKNSKILKNIPVAGTLLSAALTEGEIQSGKDPGREWTKFGLSTAGGLGMAGVAAFIPGPGWAFAATVAGGQVVDLASNYVVDHWGEVQPKMDEMNYSSTPYGTLFRPS